MRNQTTAKYNIDDFDDLTRFADESFDTNEVDLFQFSGDESSPLTRLKSVILSLDWDITDEYLQELADELANLAPDWRDDKVAGLYLQGMGKIGKYLRLRGAHAHPNSIKLLLTYFHHFETIVSSPDMGNDRIVQMVHNDVRKFKVLQYQIKLKEEGATTDDAASAGKGLGISRETSDAEDSLRNFKAAILELDWEVSDNSLARFSTALQTLGKEKIQNKSALILIQGMQALGQYISDERAQAHPEVFNLLHSFHDGLEQILDTGPAAPDQQQKKTILLDRVNRLNHLKTRIAPKDSKVPAAIPIPQVAAQPEEQIIPAAPEAKEQFPSPAFPDESPATGPAPVAVSPPVDEEALSPQEIEMSAPEEELALSEEDIFSGIEAVDAPETDIAAQSSLATDFPIELDMEEKQPAAGSAGIESEIDALFAASSKRAMLSSEEEYPEEELPASAYQAVEDEVSDVFIDTNVGERQGITPALADVVEESGFEESDELDLETKIDLDEQLDFLFGESPQGTEHSEPAASLFDEEFEDPIVSTQSLPGNEDYLFADAPGEEALFAESGQEPSLFQEESPVEEPVATAEQERSSLAAELSLDDDDDEASPAAALDDLPAALADAEPPEEEVLLAAEPDEEITSKLDSFFDFADPEEQPGLQSEGDSVFAEEVTPAEAKQDEVILEEAAPAIEETVLSAEAEYATMPAALADAEMPEESLFASEEPVDEELTGDLDSFFAAADADVAPVPPPIPEKAEEPAIILEEPVRQPEDTTSDLEVFDDVVAALADVEPTEELFVNQSENAADLTENHEDPVLQSELDNFFDTLPTDQEPTDVERAILAVAPEETDEEYFEEKALLSTSVETASLESALADVAFSEKTAGQSIKVDPAIEQFVNSFWDDKPSAAASPDEPVETIASNDAFTGVEEATIQEQAVALDEPIADSGTQDTPALIGTLSDFGEQEISLTETAALEEDFPIEEPAAEAAIATDGQVQETEKTAFADTVQTEQDLFAAAQRTQETVAETPTTDSAAGDLELESSTVVFSPEAAGFDDILDSSEVQEFLLSGQDIEDIPDEELEFADDPANNDEEFIPDAALPVQEEAVFTDLPDTLDPADTVAIEENALVGIDDLLEKADTDDGADSSEHPADELMNLEKSSNEDEAVFAFGEEEDMPAVGDALLDAASESLEEAVVNIGEETQSDALARLGASLPILLSNYTTEHLSNTNLHLNAVRENTQLSPVQTTAAGMLETVIAALPRYTGQNDKSKAMVNGLYQALAQPQEHLPLEIVTAYSEWVQSLLSETLWSEAGAPASKEYFTARDIYQELSGFRARMEEELAQLRQEIRNR